MAKLGRVILLAPMLLLLGAGHRSGARPLALGVIAWLIVVVAGFAATALSVDI